MSPVTTTERGKSIPKGQKKVVTFCKLVLKSAFQGGNLSAVLLSRVFKLDDTSFLLGEGTGRVLRRLLIGFVCVLGGSVGLSFFVEHVCQLSGFKTSSLKESISLLDLTFFFSQRRFGTVKVANGVLELSLELSNRLELLVHFDGLRWETYCEQARPSPTEVSKRFSKIILQFHKPLFPLRSLHFPRCQTLP